MTRAPLTACAVAIVVALGAASAHARTGAGAGPAALGTVLHERGPDDFVVLHGQLRLRSALYMNLDLDRGPSPTTGKELFAPDFATGHDARVRVTPSLFLGDDLRLYADLDLVTASFGPAPNGVPWDGRTDAVAASFVDVRALALDWVLPIGVLSIGRMPAHFALGIAANEGDDLDDDFGDRAERIAFVAPVYGHLVAAAVDALPGDSLLGEQAVTLGVMQWRAPWEQELYRAAGRVVLDYGAALSVGWQSKGTPGVWSFARDVVSPRAPVVRRDSRFVLVDAWARLVVDRFRFEAEGWASDLVIDDPSTLPGVAIRRSIVGNPAAFALVAEARLLEPTSTALVAQLEIGAASADPAAGFPLATPNGFAGAVPGDAFGPQVDLKSGGDVRFDAARMHPLHRVDLILWRTLLGGVSEAAYARARIEGRPFDQLRLDANVVYSHAISPDSAPGGVAPLGVEVDVGAEGSLAPFGPHFGAASLRVDAGTLFPLGGLGARGGVAPTAAHMVLVRLGYAL